MAVNLSPIYGAGAQLFSDIGNPLSGGKIYTYAAGTSTSVATYTSGAGNISHSNPIVLDAAGRVPSGEIWLTDGIAYKFVIKDKNDVLIGTYDNLIGINSNFVAFTSQEETQTATQGQTVFTLATIQYQPGVNNLLVFVNGSKQIVNNNYIETSSTVVTFVDGLNVGDVVDFTTAMPTNTGVVTAAQVSYEYPTSGVVQTVQTKLEQYLSVKDFGADPTGVTDSTSAILAACAAAMDNSSDAYKGVLFPAGTYRFTNLTISPHISLIADGDVILTTDISTGVAITISNIAGNANIGYRNKVLSGNFFITNSNTSNTATGIYIGDTPPSTTYTAAYCTFENIAVVGFSIGHTYGNNAYLISWINCSFTGRGTSGTTYGLACTSSSALVNSGENMLYVGCVISEYTYAFYIDNADIEICYMGGSIDANESALSNVSSLSFLQFNQTHFEWYVSTQPLFNINTTTVTLNNCYFLFGGASTTASAILAGIGGTNGSLLVKAPIYNIGVVSTPYYALSSATASLKYDDAIRQYGTNPTALILNSGNGTVSKYVLSTDIPQVLSSSGYAKLPLNPVSGQQLIYQWGTVTTVAGNTFTNWNYPIAFPNAVVSVQATPNYSGAASYANVNSPTTSACAVETSVACSVYCFAIGY